MLGGSVKLARQEMAGSGVVAPLQWGTANQMIFGFNTDIKHGDTVYHVQSEARESEQLGPRRLRVGGTLARPSALLE